MADPIIRLRVESQEYDSKLKRATDGLLAFEQSCHKAQKSMADADKATIDYVREMGKMETVNKTAKGSVSELTKSFVELSAQYNRLTDEEKKSPFGQALAKSIDELKQRVQQGKAELDSINRSLGDTSRKGGETGSILDSLAGKFGLNASQLMKFGGVLGVATTALNVAKDAFFANEQQLDEWGRICASSESLYRGFLHTLNTGDISGYLSNINTIIKAARDAYNAIDELNTYNAFNQINVQKTRTALNATMADLREGTGSKEDVQAASKNYINELKVRMQKEQDAYKKSVYKLAAERGVGGSDLYNALSGSYGNYEKLKGTKPTGSQTVFYGGGMFGGGGSYQKAVPQNATERMGVALRAINDTELQQLQALGAQAQQTAQEIEQVRKQTARAVNAGGGTTRTSGGGGGTGRRRGGGGGTTNVPAIPKTEQQLNSEKIRELNQEYVTATEQRKAVIRSEIKVLQSRNEEIQRLIDESNGKISEDTSSFNLKNIQAWIGGIKKKLNEAELGTEVYDRLTAQLSDATALSNLLGAFINNGLSMTDIDAKPIWEKILSGKDIPAEELQTILDSLNTKLAELHLAPLKLDIEGNVSTDTSLFSQKNVQDLISTTKQQLEQSQIGSDFYNALTAKLYDATALSSLLGEFVKNGIDFAEVDPTAMWSKIFGGEDVATEELQKMLDTLNAYLAEHGLDLMKFNTDGSLSNVESKKGGNKFDEGLDKVSKGMSGLSTIMSGLQQTGVKIPSGIQDAVAVMQGVISVVQGVQAVISLFSSTTETANTAALIANTAAVGTLTTVMAANTAMSFMPFLRFGGIAHAATGLVAGHDFSDNVPVMVSSGELILNRAQQGNLAQQLDGGGGFDNLHLETSVRAEEFRIMLNSNSMRRGKGEYVTTKRQR